MEIALRKASFADRESIIAVERKATPNLSYLAEVFDDWVQDQAGGFIVAELDGEVVACGKLSLMPDGSAWLEALRVIPECQGLGIGKRFYQRFFEIANKQAIPAMRMYTGVRNAVSKGLAERFGFHLAATYRGAWATTERNMVNSTREFELITDPEQASELLLPYHTQWAGFLVMNRTFYALTPALCQTWANAGMIYGDDSGNVVVLGSRFMPKQALHIACFGQAASDCLSFAQHRARELGVARLQCMFPPSATEIEQTLLQRGFQLEASDCIVMEVRVQGV